MINRAECTCTLTEEHIECAQRQQRAREQMAQLLLDLGPRVAAQRVEQIVRRAHAEAVQAC